MPDGKVLVDVKAKFVDSFALAPIRELRSVRERKQNGRDSLQIAEWTRRVLRTIPHRPLVRVRQFATPRDAA